MFRDVIKHIAQSGWIYIEIDNILASLYVGGNFHNTTARAGMLSRVFVGNQITESGAIHLVSVTNAVVANNNIYNTGAVL